MDIMKREDLAIQSETDIVAVRLMVRKFACEISLGIIDQTKLMTAASEIARNTFVYGKGGMATVETLSDQKRLGIRMTFEDRGPGIADIELALTDGYTSGRGLGLGLGGSKRLVNEFEINSRIGEGTRVVLTRWKR